MAKYLKTTRISTIFLAMLRDARGVVAIEFSYIIPIMVMMVICAADLGFGIYRTMQVQHAAQAGAQYAMFNTFNSKGISSAVRSATSFSSITATPSPSEYCGCANPTSVQVVSCGSTCSGGKVAGNYVSVSTQASYVPLLPYPLIASSFTLNGKADVRIR